MFQSLLSSLAPKTSTFGVSFSGLDFLSHPLAITTYSVPDGGTTLALLGVGIVGLLLLRRQFGRK